MSSYAYLYGCGEDSEAVHYCHDCPGQGQRESAGARSGALCRIGYLPTLMANPTSLAVWQAGVANGNIIIIPATRGNYDPGEPKELPGYGDTKVSYGDRTMILNLIDPDYEENYAFYNEISRRKDMVPIFRTSSLLHIFDKPAVMKAADPVGEDIDTDVVWNLNCQVVSGNLPSLHKAANVMSIFTCPSF